MKKSPRKLMIAGNWKMNKTRAETRELLRPILHDVGQEREISIVVCPPFTALGEASQLLDGSAIALGAQNFYPAISGAFTGEISPDMLRDFYVSYVILGHSERRQLLGEKDEWIAEKVACAFRHHLTPILCIGETLSERENAEQDAVIRHQLEVGLSQISPEEAQQLVLAYEPVWAIGTGKTATPEQAQEIHALIRHWLSEHFGQEIAKKVHILYGGSMKPSNAADLLAQPDIDGGLIGGASLNANDFIALIEIAKGI